MYHWDYKGVFVLLTDDEENDFVRRVTNGDAVEAIAYHTNREVRKRCEGRINHLLKMSLLSDPESFRKQYVFRSLYDAQARTLFPKMLDAYGRATKRATVGRYGVRTWSDALVSDLVETTAGRLYDVTLLVRSWIPWRYRASGHLVIPADSIERLVGTVDNFVLMTDACHVRFGNDAVRVLFLGAGDRGGVRHDPEANPAQIDGFGLS